MSKCIYVINGPNLNLLGLREPDIYGHEALKDLEALCAQASKKHGFSLKFLQSNHEGVLVDWIQEARDNAVAIIINPAAYSHTSIAILDALKAFEGLVVEVHISNIHQREAFRHHSFVSMRANSVIAGCGLHGYEYAFDYIAHKI